MPKLSELNPSDYTVSDSEESLETPSAKLSTLEKKDVQTLEKPQLEEKNSSGDLISLVKDVPYVGEAAEPIIREKFEPMQDYMVSGGRSMLGGLGAKAEARARAAVKMLRTGGDYESLLKEEQEKIKKESEQIEERSPLITGVSKIGADLAPGIISGGTSLLGQAAVSGAMGAAEALGRYDESKDGKDLGKEISIGGGIGLASVPVTHGVGKLVGLGAEKVLESIQNSPYARQLAATAINAAQLGKEKAKTIMGIEGKDVFKRDQDLTKQITESVISPITDKYNAYTRAFKDAAKQGKTVIAGDNISSVLSTQKNIEKLMKEMEAVNLDKSKLLPSWTDENIFKYFQGDLPPDVADTMYQEMKRFGVPDSIPGLQNIKQSVQETILKSRNKSLDPKLLSKLNTEYEAANAALEPMIQPIKRKAAEKGYQIKDVSDLSPEQLNRAVFSFIEDKIKNVGRSQNMGSEARVALDDAIKMLEEANKRGNLGLDTKKIRQAVESQGYLSAAKQAEAGGLLTSEGASTIGGTIQKGLKKWKAPYALMESIAESPSVQKASKILLQGTPENLTEIGRKLEQIPAVAHLGSGLVRESMKGDYKKIYPVVFAILQNPVARQIIEGGEGQEDEQ